MRSAMVGGVELEDGRLGALSIHRVEARTSSEGVLAAAPARHGSGTAAGVEHVHAAAAGEGGIAASHDNLITPFGTAGEAEIAAAAEDRGAALIRYRVVAGAKIDRVIARGGDIGAPDIGILGDLGTLFGDIEIGSAADQRDPGLFAVHGD